MRLTFLSKYRETGLLVMRVGLGCLFIILMAGPLVRGPAAWAHLGLAGRQWGLHSHPQAWGFVAALIGSLGGVLMIFGLFFRIGVLMGLALTIAYAQGAARTGGFLAALPSIELALVLLGLLFVGPGKYSVDKT